MTVHASFLSSGCSLGASLGVMDVVVFFFFFVFFVFFFFQAEDGIRYLVRSRGLGDVCKRESRYWDRCKRGQTSHRVNTCQTI